MTSAERAALAAESIANYGTATNPLAAAAIATLTTPAAGVYTVVAEAVLSGTIGAADLNNFEVRKGATVLQTIIVPAVTLQRGSVTLRILVNGAQSITINATANASGVAAVYNAALTATRVL